MSRILLSCCLLHSKEEFWMSSHFTILTLTSGSITQSSNFSGPVQHSTTPRVVSVISCFVLPVGFCITRCTWPSWSGTMRESSKLSPDPGTVRFKHHRLSLLYRSSHFSSHHCSCSAGDMADANQMYSSRIYAASMSFNSHIWYHEF